MAIIDLIGNSYCFGRVDISVWACYTACIQAISNIVQFNFNEVCSPLTLGYTGSHFISEIVFRQLLILFFGMCLFLNGYYKFHFTSRLCDGFHKEKWMGESYSYSGTGLAHGSEWS